MKQNPLTNCDSYKLSHMAQFPEGTTQVYSNFTPRNLKYLNAPEGYETNKVVWFGLQGFIQEMINLWNDEFFNQEIEPIIADFTTRVMPFVGPSGFDFDKIRELHKVGYLPLCIKSLPEGSRVNAGVPLFTITNTQPDFYWLPNFLETWLSAELWKTTTSATIADIYKRILTDYAEQTGCPQEFVSWQAHDFSMRGMSGVVDAAKSGAGHLLSFTGTDCLPAVDYVEQYYEGKDTFIGGSVPATEHSVMCMGGQDDEIGTFRRLIVDTYPAGIVSIVSDTWDFWKVITEYAPALKEQILGRIPDAFGNAKVVFRPDSGDPVKIICGDIDAPVQSPEFKGAVECLWDTFGGTYTDKGYRVLNSHVGLIYGDSITPERCKQIMQQLKEKGFASCNVVMGVGSYTYQYNTRDTLGSAMKATYGVVNGEGRAIFKNPKTDDGTKKSAKGLLRVEKEGDDFVLYDEQTTTEEGEGELKVVFSDGCMCRRQTFAELRERLVKG